MGIVLMNNYNEKDLLEKIFELEKRIIELENQNRFIIDSVVGFDIELKLKHRSFAVLVLSSGFSSSEIKNLESLVAWAIQNIDKYSKDIFIEKFKNDFSKSLPNRKNMLKSVIKTFMDDGLYLPLCTLLYNNI
jgi:hypothetical protein